MSEQQPKSRMPLYLTLIVAGVFIAGAALFPLLVNAQDQALQSAGIDYAPVTVDKTAPSLALTDATGKPVSLDDYRGKVVLVNNWATWCPPCQSEMPELQAYYEAHLQNGFVIVAIESGEPVNTVLAFARKYKLTFPVWLDPQGIALEAFNNWDLPSSYIIDRGGTIRMSWTGPVDRATLEKYVTPLLEK
jgi:cytochrome c biogenesis protein CcmG, thiol:disulfide interchange protein DsbE